MSLRDRSAPVLAKVSNNAAPGVEHHFLLTSTPGGAFSLTHVDGGAELEVRNSGLLPASMKMRRPYVLRRPYGLTSFAPSFAFNGSDG